MNRLARAVAEEDAIDWFAREIVRNPERAETLKAALRERIGLASVHRLEVRHPAHLAQDEDADDLWDNLPV